MSEETRRRRDELLSAYLDDALGADERATVEALLREDAGARAWVDEMRALMEATRAADVAPPVPPDLHDRIRARLDAADKAAKFAARGPAVLYSRLGDEELRSSSPAPATARPPAAPAGSRPRGPLRAGTIAAWVTMAAALVLGVVLLEQRGIRPPVPEQQNEDTVRQTAATPESAEAAEPAPPRDDAQAGEGPPPAAGPRARAAQPAPRTAAAPDAANAAAPLREGDESPASRVESDAASSGRGTSEAPPSPPPTALAGDPAATPAPAAATKQPARDEAEPLPERDAEDREARKKAESVESIESADSAAGSAEAARTTPPGEQEERVRGRDYQEKLSFAKTAPAATPPACPSIWVAEPPLARAPGRPAVTIATLEPVARELGGVIVPEISPIARFVVPRAEWPRALERLEALGFVLPAGYPQPPGDAPCAAARLVLDPS